MVFFQRIFFSGHLDEDEKLLYVGHKHWIEIFKKVFKLSFLGLLIPWTMYLFTGALPLFWLAVVLTVIVYIRLFYIIIDWYFDAILITSHSLMFIEWHGIFHRESTRIEYHSVESISIEISGFWSTIFSFGTLSIERDAAPSIEMAKIRNPKRLELEIMAGKEEHEDRVTSESSEALKEILSNLVKEHIANKGWKRRK